MAQRIDTQCCIAGGGPAGMMLGLLLARAGVDVVVLEKHADFLRDFRGDTVHPSTLNLFHELGWLEEFLALPDEKAVRLFGMVGPDEVQIADFSRINGPAKFIAMVPQWDLLDFLARKARAYPGFRLVMQGKVTDLIREGATVVGVQAETPDGPLEVRAKLTVGADGRGSVVREKAGLKVKDLGAPLDVFWFSLPRLATDKGETMGRFLPGAVFVEIARTGHWQCALVIRKGGADEVRARGLEAFRARIAQIEPAFAARVATITDWEQVKLLTVRVDRLDDWHEPGLLCIGDAAHAMSPIGGVGINLAVQDAVAAANILWKPLIEGVLDESHLEAVQKRREWPAKATQFIRVQGQNRIIAPTLAAQDDGKPFRAPWLLRNLKNIPILRGLPAQVVGIGVRPEHIRSPEQP